MTEETTSAADVAALRSQLDAQDRLLMAVKNKVDLLFYATAAIHPKAVDAALLTVVQDREQAVVDARFAHLTEDLDTAGDDADTDPQEK